MTTTEAAECTCRYQEDGKDLWLCPAGQGLKLDAHGRWGSASVDYVHHVIAAVQRLEREQPAHAPSDEPAPMVKWVSMSTLRADSLDQLTDMLKAAGKLGLGYRVVHDAGNNPGLLGPDGDEGARPSWTVNLLHYYLAPSEAKP